MHQIAFRACCLSLLLATACGYDPQKSPEQDGAGQGGSTGSTVNAEGGVAPDGSLALDAGKDARLPDAPTDSGSGATGGSVGGATGTGGVVAGGATSTQGGATSTGGAVGGKTSTGGTLAKLDAGVSPDVMPSDVPPAAVTCPALVPPLHGDLSKTSSNVGSVASYTCLPGYGTANPATRTCQADGTWSGTEPKCLAVNCGALPKPDNGSVDVPSTTFESQATYACDPNFGMVGDATRTCQANGTWSGSAPTCKCVQTMCDGVCADLKSDNRHCGACGKACSAGSPSTAQCTPTGCLVTLATGISLGDIAVDVTNVYWADTNAGNPGTVNKVPLGGGPTTALATGQLYPGSLAVDATTLYWASSNEEAVKKVPIAGGPVTTIATGENGPCCLVLNATDLYYHSTRGIVRFPLAGGTATALPSTYGVGFSLALDATNVYWRVDVSGGLTAQLLKMPLDGSSAPVSLITSSSMGALVVNGSTLYWTMPAGTVAGAGGIAKMPVGGSASTTLASGLNEPSDLAVDGTNVYFTSYQDGTVSKVPVAGGTPTVIASKQKLPSAIVVDGTSVYWTNYGGSTTPIGAVMKLSPK